MNRKAALAMGASFGMAFLAACSDSSTAPKAANVVVPKSSFAIGTVTQGSTVTAVVGKVFVCKTGNVGGDFAFVRTDVGTTLDPNRGVTTDQTIATGTCLEVANDNSPSGNGSNLTINEAPAANTVQTVASCVFVGIDNIPQSCSYSNGGNLFFNSFHGYVITYNNVFTPPTTGCTYTKGWYQSKNATLTGVDGLTIEVEAAFFAATPNKTGSVSFVGPNNLLNLYQQLLAALENGGAGGPQAVQDAIADAQAGTTVTGTVLTTTLTDTEISDLINTLSAFNEGTFEGWPHC